MVPVLPFSIRHALGSGQFLKILSVGTCVCVRVLLRLLITSSISGVIRTPYNWLNKSYSFYMAAIVIVGGGHGFRIEAHHRKNLIIVSYLCISCYFHFNIPFKQLYTSSNMEHFIYKGGCGMCKYMGIKVFKRRAGLLATDKWLCVMHKHSSRSSRPATAEPIFLYQKL